MVHRLFRIVLVLGWIRKWSELKIFFDRGIKISKIKRIAIVGSGNMASEWAKVVTQHEFFDLAGVYSRDINRAKFFAARFPTPVIARSVSELYEMTKADIVIVAVSEGSLREVFLLVALYPWVRVLEKPAGINLEESIELAKASLRLSEPTYVALNRRFYFSTMTMRGQVEKESGSRFIQIEDQHDTESALASGRDPSVVRNWMFANAIHTVDLFRVFGRGHWRVESSLKEELSSTGFVISAVLKSSGGDVGLYTSLWNLAGTWSVACHSSQYVWEMRPLEMLSRTERLTRKVENFAGEEREKSGKPGLWQFLEDLNSVSNESQSRLVTLAEGLDSVRLVHQIYKGVEP